MEPFFGLNINITDLLLIFMMIICITTDLINRLIYNKVLLPFLAAAIVVNITYSGLPGLEDSIKGFLTGFVLLIIPYAKGGIGGGDVKLMAVIGAIKGPVFVIATFFFGSVAGGVFALIALIRHRRLISTIKPLLAYIPCLPGRGGVYENQPAGPANQPEKLFLPYSLAIGAGVASAYCPGILGLLR